jgi:hypothetical protein
MGKNESVPKEDGQKEALSYVYALGRIEARPPSLAIDREYAQARRRADTAGKTDQQVFHEVLSMPENQYLVRQMCWVFSVQGMETYILRPRHPGDFHLLVDAVRSEPNPNDIDIVVGMRGPTAPAELCNGLALPIVAFDQIYSFDRDELIKAIPKPEHLDAKQFRPAVNEMFDHILQLTDNAGTSDEHRALNYLAVRYPAIYATAAEQFARDFSLTDVDVRISPLGSPRSVLEVIFTYTNRSSDFVEKFFSRVDISEEFPFLVTKLSPYYNR